jgi:hypothetical protein
MKRAWSSKTLVVVLVHEGEIQHVLGLQTDRDRTEMEWAGHRWVRAGEFRFVRAE